VAEKAARELAQPLEHHAHITPELGRSARARSPPTCCAVEILDRIV
jgi:hypothetical protein